MKNIYFLFVPLVAVFALSSCEKEKEESTDTTPVVLETPVLTISEQTSDSFTITWPSVTHAMYYEYEVNGIPSIEPQTLVSVIAHELAHSDKFRHCKYHTRLTYLIIDAYDNYKKTGQIRPFNNLVYQLKRGMK